MPIHHPGTVASPPPFEAKKFFEEVVAKALVARKEAGERLGGSVLVEVDGAGAWRIDLSRATVEAGMLDADAALKVDAEGFESLIRGKVQVETLVKQGRLLLDGDPDALQLLALLLRP